MGYLTYNNLATFYHVKNFANFEKSEIFDLIVD